MKILLFQHHQNDPLSWAIKQVTREPYVHAAILVDESTREIIEAVTQMEVKTRSAVS